MLLHSSNNILCIFMKVGAYMNLISVNKIDNLIVNYKHLLSSILANGLAFDESVYVSQGLVNIAIVPVNMPLDNSLPAAFIYTEGNRVFIAVSDRLDDSVKHLAKAYMLGIYLMCESEITDGVYKRLFFYPDVPAGIVSQEAMYFARSILMPKDAFISNVLSLSHQDSLDKVKPSTILSELAEKYKLPKVVVADRLHDIKSSSRAKGVTYKSCDENKEKKILRRLEKDVHIVVMDTFESSKVMLDLCSSEISDTEPCNQEASMLVSAEATEAMRSEDCEIDIYEDYNRGTDLDDLLFNLIKIQEYFDSITARLGVYKVQEKRYNQLMTKIDEETSTSERYKLLSELHSLIKDREKLKNSNTMGVLNKTFNGESYHSFRKELKTLISIIEGESNNEV